jgi:hypothetical protein
MPWMLLFHPGLLICLVLVSIAWPFGERAALICAGLVALAYGYAVFAPLRVSRLSDRPRPFIATLGLLAGVVLSMAVFLAILSLWDATIFLRWPAAFFAAYYAGAAFITVVVMTTVPHRRR